MAIMRLNLENAEKIIGMIKKRSMEEDNINNLPYCCCKPQSTEDKDVCPCFDARINEKCCCGLYKFYDHDGNEVLNN